MQRIYSKLSFMLSNKIGLFKCTRSLGLCNPISMCACAYAAMHACTSANNPLLIVALSTISAIATRHLVKSS